MQPNVPRRRLLCLKPKLPRREWVAQQVRDYLPGPDWIHAGLIYESSVASAKGTQRVGRRRYPLYLTTSTFVDLFELRPIMCTRRRMSHNSEFSPPREPPLVWGGEVHLLWEIESRNINGARRRWVSPRVSPTGEEVGPITLKGGTTIQLPSGDEHAPGHPLRVLALHHSLGSFESSSDSDEASWPGALFLGGQTPIRSSGDLNAPCPQRPRTDSTTAQSAVDEEYLARHESPCAGYPGFRCGD